MLNIVKLPYLGTVLHSFCDKVISCFVLTLKWSLLRVCKDIEFWKLIMSNFAFFTQFDQVFVLKKRNVFSISKEFGLQIIFFIPFKQNTFIDIAKNCPRISDHEVALIMIQILKSFCTYGIRFFSVSLKVLVLISLKHLG